MIDLDPQPESEQPRRPRGVPALLAAVAGIASVLIISGQLVPRAVTTPTVTTQPMSASIAARTAAPTTAADLATLVANLSDQFQFIPLLPAPAAAGATASRAGCGTSSSWCLRVGWGSSAMQSLELLEGPAGCCLDAVRTGGHQPNDVELRAGVWAHWEDVDGRFGGPILWWVETGTTTPTYIAISGGVSGGIKDLLVQLARSPPADGYAMSQHNWRS